MCYGALYFEDTIAYGAHPENLKRTWLRLRGFLEGPKWKPTTYSAGSYDRAKTNEGSYEV